MDTLDDLSLQIISALQANPRASWLSIGKVLAVDPTTVARRWGQLRERGAAWVSCQPLRVPNRSVAFLEMRTEPGRQLDVAAILAKDPNVTQVDITAGSRDLIVTAGFAGADALSDYVLTRVGHTPFVTWVAANLMVRRYTEGSQWSLNELSKDQVKALKGGAATLVERSADKEDFEIAGHLSINGRMSVEGLASRLGTTHRATARRLRRLLNEDRLRLRCDIARSVSGWPVSEWLFAKVPSDQLDAVAQFLTGIPCVRGVFSTASSSNLLIAVWLRTLDDAYVLEAEIMARLPQLHFVDRSIVLRSVKLAGHLLDDGGFSVGTVPLSLL